MALQTVANAFPNDVVPPLPLPPVGVAPAPVGVGGAPAPAVLMPAPQYRLRSLYLLRTHEAAQVQPGYGLQPITLAPVDAATGAAPAAFAFGTQSTSFTPFNPPAGGFTETFLLCPGDANPVQVHFEIQGNAPNGLRLELFARGENQAIWSRTFRWDDPFVTAVPGAPANQFHYRLDFDGNVGNPAGDPNIVTHTDNAERFPGGWLTAEHGPYKFTLSLTLGVPPQTCIASTYFQVPAHKFKLIRYTPTTDLGCFGLEWDPASTDLRVINKAFIGYEGAAPPGMAAPITHNGAFAAGPRATLHNQIRSRIFQDWSARYLVRVGQRELRPVIFIEPHHIADVNYLQAVPVGYASYAAYLMDETRQHGCDFPILLRNMNSGAGITPSADGHYLTLYYPISFEEVSNLPNRAAEVYLNDVDLVRAKMKEALARAPMTVTSIEGANRLSIVLHFAEHANDLDATTAAWVQDLAALLNQVVPSLSSAIPLFLTAYASQGRNVSRRTRNAASNVKRILAGILHQPTVPPGGPPPGQHAEQMRDQAVGYALQPDTAVQGAEPTRRVHIDIDVRPVPPGAPPPLPQYPPSHPYMAVVHEFGHVFGLPDEYMDYANPQNRCLSIVYSQPRFVELAQQLGVEDPDLPQGGATSINSNLMSMGTVYYERYYLTFVEALAKMMSLGNANGVTFGAAPDRNVNMAGYAPLEDPAFAPLVQELRTVADIYERGHLQVPPPPPPAIRTPADFEARVTQRVAASIAPPVLLYNRVADADGIDPAFATGRTGLRLFAQAAILDNGECLHCSIQTDAVKALIEMDTQGANVLNQVFHPPLGNDRVHMVLRAQRAFGGGTGRLHVSTPGVVQFYNAAHGGAVVNPAGPFTEVNLTSANGVEVWAEGGGHGTTDVTLELLTAGGGGAAPQVIARSAPQTVVCARPAELLLNGAPAPAAGLFVPLQGCLNSTIPRMKLVLKQQGDLGGTLIRLDKPAGAGGDFDLYQHQNGGAALALPFDVPDAWYNNDEAEVWVEGTTVSGAVGDRSLTVGTAPGALTPVPVTVVELHDLEITVPATPPLTARTIGLTQHPVPGMMPPPLRTDPTAVQHPNAARDHVIKPHLANQGFYDAPPMPAPPGGIRRADYGTDDFAVNHPLVLIEGSLLATRNVSVKATVSPGTVPVQWIVERNPDDDERLERLVTGPVLPTLNNPAPVIAGGQREQTGELKPDHVGSFRLRLQAHGATLMTVNTVLVRAAGLQDKDESRASIPRNVSVLDLGPLQEPAAADQNFIVRAGTFQGAMLGHDSESRFGAVLRGTVHFIGGGPDGRLGQEAVYAGWIQNLTRTVIRATYVDTAPPLQVRIVRLRATRNAMQGHFKANDPYFFNNAVSPAAVALDAGVMAGAEIVLDTGRRPAGGSTASLGHSHIEARQNHPELGWTQEASCADAPNTQFFLRHPARATALLDNADYEHAFRAYLCAWTDAQRQDVTDVSNGQCTGAAGTRLYGVIGNLEWHIRGSWTVEIRDGNWKGAGNGGVVIPHNRVRVRAVRGSEMQLNMAQPFTAYSKARPAENLVEVKAPTMLMVFGWASEW